MYKIAQKHKIDKTTKENIVKNLYESLTSAKGIIVLNYQGTTVAQITQFRRELAKYNAKFNVVKNKLFELALQKSSQEISKIKHFIHGAIGIVYCYDEDKIVDVVKFITKFVEENTSLKIVGGYLYNHVLLIDRIKDIASLPSKEELLAKVVYLISSPIRRFYYVLKSPLNSLINIIYIKSKKIN